jgi:hypothetical protein
VIVLIVGCLVDMVAVDKQKINIHYMLWPTLSSQKPLPGARKRSFSAERSKPRTTESTSLLDDNYIFVLFFITLFLLAIRITQII